MSNYRPRITDSQLNKLISVLHLHLYRQPDEELKELLDRFEKEAERLTFVAWQELKQAQKLEAESREAKEESKARREALAESLQAMVSEPTIKPNGSNNLE